MLKEPDEDKIIEGIMINVYIDTSGKEEDIKSLLDQLPSNFKDSGGGGNSFLLMCETKDGNQWTGSHKTVEELVILGIASEQAKFTLTRDLWFAMPGSMPYITVMDT